MRHSPSLPRFALALVAASGAAATTLPASAATSPTADDGYVPRARVIDTHCRTLGNTEWRVARTDDGGTRIAARGRARGEDSRLWVSTAWAGALDADGRRVDVRDDGTWRTVLTLSPWKPRQKLWMVAMHAPGGPGVKGCYVSLRPRSGETSMRTGADDSAGLAMQRSDGVWRASGTRWRDVGRLTPRRWDVRLRYTGADATVTRTARRLERLVVRSNDGVVSSRTRWNWRPALPDGRPRAYRLVAESGHLGTRWLRYSTAPASTTLARPTDTGVPLSPEKLRDLQISP